MTGMPEGSRKTKNKICGWICKDDTGSSTKLGGTDEDGDPWLPRSSRICHSGKARFKFI